MPLHRRERELTSRALCFYRLVFVGSCLPSRASVSHNAKDIDPSGWHIDENHANLRRKVFWEIFLADKWRSLRLGRPPCIGKEMVSCDFPFDDEPVERGEVLLSFSAITGRLKPGNTVSTWRYRFARDVMADIAELLCSTEVLAYSEIEKLDARLQAFSTHPGVFNSTVGSSFYNRDREQSTKSRDGQGPMLTLFDKQIGMALLINEEYLADSCVIATQTLHRHYFAAAMLNQKVSPFEGIYATSVLATYRSAVVLQHLLSAYVPTHPNLVSRLPYVGKMSLVNGVSTYLSVRHTV